MYLSPAMCQAWYYYLWSWYYHHLFTNEVTEAQKHSLSFPTTTNLGTSIVTKLKVYALSTPLDNFPASFPSAGGLREGYSLD